MNNSRCSYERVAQRQLTHLSQANCFINHVSANWQDERSLKESFEHLTLDKIKLVVAENFHLADSRYCQ